MTSSTSTDVIVVGGGAIGLACALQVAARGLSVRLIERGLPGAETTTSTGGGVRLQFDRPDNIQLSRLSWPFWQSFAEHSGVDPEIREIGYLFLARAAGTVADLRATGALHAQLGVPSEWLEGEALSARWPALGARHAVAGAYAPSAFYLNQFRVVQGLVRLVDRAGVRIMTGSPVRRLVLQGERVTGAETAAGTFLAHTIINAAGPWCRKLANTVGLDFPLVARQLGLMYLQTGTAAPADLPWLFDLDSGLHVRTDATGMLLAGGLLREAPRVDPDAFERKPDASWQTLVLEGLSLSYEWFAASFPRVAQAWCGLHAGPPDAQPILEVSMPGLLTVSGFSGSGLMHAPAAGLLAAELIAEGNAHSMDVSGFSASRFAPSESGWRAAF